jgi:hypothetical protein
MFAGVTEGRMADIVDQGQRLGQVFIQSQGGGHGTRNLRYFHRMGQPRTEMIRRPMRKYLRLTGQPAEGPRMNDACTVALERCSIRMGGFEMLARYERVAGEADHGIWRKRFLAYLCEAFHTLQV